MEKKVVDKTIMVLNVVHALPEKVEQVKQIVDEWQDFLVKHSKFISMEMLCVCQDKVVWMEEWPNRIVWDAFVAEHVNFSDFPSRMFACSRGVPLRKVYRIIA